MNIPQLKKKIWVGEIKQEWKVYFYFSQLQRASKNAVPVGTMADTQLLLWKKAKDIPELLPHTPPNSY